MWLALINILTSCEKTSSFLFGPNLSLFLKIVHVTSITSDKRATATTNARAAYRAVRIKNTSPHNFLSSQLSMSTGLSSWDVSVAVKKGGGGWGGVVTPTPQTQHLVRVDILTLTERGNTLLC